ncbi:hypothetical protein ACQ86D_43770 [Streptomyces galilaeus]
MAFDRVLGHESVRSVLGYGRTWAARRSPRRNSAAGTPTSTYEPSTASAS